MISLEIIKKKCKECENIRKFVKDSARDQEDICGNCWDWETEPKFLKLTDEEIKKLKSLL